jgi:hypothetical protein
MERCRSFDVDLTPIDAAGCRQQCHSSSMGAACWTLEMKMLQIFIVFSRSGNGLEIFKFRPSSGSPRKSKLIFASTRVESMRFPDCCATLWPHGNRKLAIFFSGLAIRSRLNESRVGVGYLWILCWTQTVTNNNCPTIPIVTFAVTCSCVNSTSALLRVLFLRATASPANRVSDRHLDLSAQPAARAADLSCRSKVPSVPRCGAQCPPRTTSVNAGSDSPSSGNDGG